MRRYAFWLLAALAAAGRPAAADVTLPHIFGSHMVLQRDRELPVWGWAAPGEKVTVQLGDRPAVSATANDKGEWRATLPATPAGGPFTLKVAGKNTITLDDVLVGEVWLCSGQSNMQFTVSGAVNAQREIAAANFPKIRHIMVPLVPASTPQKDFNGAWQVCSPQTVGGFSACAYFMGRQLFRDLNVPIGLIASSWGGTRIEPWTPPVGFAAVPALSRITQEVLLADPHTPAYKQGMAGYLDQVDTWLKGAREALAQEATPKALPALPQQFLPMAERPSPQQQPTTLYNAMIYPLVPFAIKGAIWYQGESNHNEGMLYTEKMKALIAGWRKVWGEGDFPFYYVQIAPYSYGNENPYTLAEFWEAQAAALQIPNTGMAVINDIGNVDNIHPTNKQEVGRRLALLALAGAYGRKDVVASGPTFKSLSVEGNKLRVRFDNAPNGLASRDGKPLDWFEIIGKDNDGWVKANAAIDGDSVLLSSPEVKEPAAMRFAWHRNAEPNLMNKEGLPATAFRAGKVPERDYLALNVPEAKEYELVYTLDITKAGANIAYDVDRRAQVTKPFDRIAYFLELQKPGEKAQWAWVSMDAFTTDLGKIGVPTVASKASFQRNVANMNVLCSVPGVVNGNGLKGGNIEFWPNNYGPLNKMDVPGASSELWDFGDEINVPDDGYGSMQIHNHDAKQTIIAFNNWRAGGNADVGIGNSTGRTRDWTFAANASTYTLKKLRVLVRTKK